MPSSTSAGPVLDWIYGYKALPTHSAPLPGKTVGAQKLNAMAADSKLLLPLAC